MTLRRFALVICFIPSLLTAEAAAQGRAVTENFEVTAPTAELAKRFGDAAEKYRIEKANEWLGSEMPRWSKRCPLVVEITIGRTGGATTFTFGRSGGVLSQEMKIFGDVPQLLNSVLPHEVTHTVLAHHFGQAVPRWADEGGSVLSENEKERLDHDIKCREFLNAGRAIVLRQLLPMKEYPRDMIVLYAQGYSVCAYLIDLGGGGLKGRKKFLDFLESGMSGGGRNWEKAVRSHYSFDGVDDLEAKWIDSLRKPRAVATGGSGNRSGSGGTTLAKGTETRTSALPGMPALEPPVVARGAIPAYDDRNPSSYKATQPAPSYSPGPPPVPRLLPPELPHR
jgi:hypothetical protein